MRSDVTKILFDGEETVTMPLALYEELRTFARGHGETDLPVFQVAPVPAPSPVLTFDNLEPHFPTEDFATGIE